MKASRVTVFVLACLLWAGAKEHKPVHGEDAQSQHSRAQLLEGRIRRVETGLLPAIAISGQPVRGMTLADRMAHYKVPGVSIAVIHSGAVQWARGYGVKSKDDGEITPDTLFQAASISKTVTAVATLHLVQSGKLSLDEDVNRELTSWKIPDNEFTHTRKVTLRELLSHTAGISVHGFPGYASGERVPSLIQILNGEKPANTAPIRVERMPGSKWQYSGGGFEIVQQLLLDVTGEPFPEFMRETVLIPFGMGHSTYEQPLPSALARLAATPYRQNGEPVAGGWHTYPEMAAAGLWTTPSDLARFAIGVQRALAGKEASVLSAATARQMLTVVKGEWGLGFEVQGSGEHAHFQHGGANEGYQCFLVGYEKRGDGAAVMTNSDNGNRLVQEIIRAIAKEYDWPDFRVELRTLAKVDPRTLTPYAGRYELDPDTPVTISVHGRNLLAQLGDQSIELRPSTQGSFFATDGTEMRFEHAASGEVTQASINIYGIEFKAKKVK